MKKLFLFLLAIVLGAGAFLTGCSDGNTGGQSERKYDTVHRLDSTVGTHDLVKDGATDYRIVIPASATSWQTTAAAELTTFFKQATGITLETITDDQAEYSSQAEYLSIGQNKLFAAAGLTADERFLNSGYMIVTQGNSVYLAGGQYGDLYAVYEFLRQQFGFECYAVDEISLETNVRNKKLLVFDVLDIPDIDLRVQNWGEARFNAAYSQRLRMVSFDDVWINLGGVTFHNFFEAVPPETYGAEHPEWFSSDGKQLCLTRDADGLAAVVIEKIKAEIEANPNASAITFTPEDANTWCTCDSCNEMLEQYGTDSASYIKFVNRVAQEIDQWLKVEHPGRDVTIAVFAYYRTETAPVTRAQDGSYTAQDETVVPADNVAVLYAPIYANYHYDFFGSENSRYADIMKQWSALTDTVYLWTYSTYFGNYLLPYDNFNSMQGVYQFAYESGARYMFDQGQYNQTTVSTDWGRLKLYLGSKLQWDCQLNMRELIEDWFDNYFKDAAEPMLEFFDTQRTYYTYLRDKLNITGVTAGYPNALLDRTAFPQGVLEGFLTYFDQAYDAIAALEKTDAALYSTLKDRITLESISVRYLYYELYKGLMVSAEAEAFKDELYSDCIRLGVGRFSEARDISSYFD